MRCADARVAHHLVPPTNGWTTRRARPQTTTRGRARGEHERGQSEASEHLERCRRAGDVAERAWGESDARRRATTRERRDRDD